MLRIRMLGAHMSCQRVCVGQLCVAKWANLLFSFTTFFLVRSSQRSAMKVLITFFLTLERFDP